LQCSWKLRRLLRKREPNQSRSKCRGAAPRCIDLSWASSHLEGNTYSRLDTVALIEHGRTATGIVSLFAQGQVKPRMWFTTTSNWSWFMRSTNLRVTELMSFTAPDMPSLADCSVTKPICACFKARKK
jgi:hypothetical protein